MGESNISPLVRATVMENIELIPEVEAEFDRYFSEYSESSPPHTRIDDYLRWSFVLAEIPEGTSILDIGVGAGQFINAASRSEKFSRIHGIDITRHSKFLEPEEKSVEMTYESVVDMNFSDSEFENVTCMEVIEHLETEEMEKAISELRRVSKGRVIVTVPYCEKEPIPKYHKQRFTLTRTKEIFPNAQLTLFVREARVKWILIIEEQ